MRSTPCSGTALRTVCSGSVRGGSKVGRARAAFGAAQCQPPPPRTAGALRCSLVAPPPRAGPRAACHLSRASLEWGGGAPPPGACAAAGPPIVAPSGTASRRYGAASAVAHFARRGRLRESGPFAPSGASRP